MIQFKDKYLKINGDGESARARRGKEASIYFHSESKWVFFIMGIFRKTLNLALEVLDQSQSSLVYYLS